MRTDTRYPYRLRPGAKPQAAGLRRGAVTVWLLVTLLIILGTVALGMDGGRLLEKRRHVQAAADAAALAAAADLCDSNFYNRFRRWNKTKREARLDAYALAAANGFPNDGVNSTVTINIPPKSGSFNGQKDHVEVIIEYKMPKTFSRIFNKNSGIVKARSVAIGRPFRMGIVLLRQTGADALLNNALSTWTLLNGQIHINSTDPSAYRQNKAGLVIANSFEIAGNYVNPGGAIILGKMRTGVRRVGDPLRELPAPDPATLALRSTSRLTINTKKNVLLILQPGVYQGGISMDLLDNVLMMPGIYYIEGGGIQVTGAADLTGTGVMIYNTSGATPAGPIKITTFGKLALTAPTTGTYQGIGIFQDRSITQPITVAGNGLVVMNGSVYAAAAPVNLIGAAGGQLDTLGGAYVCSTLNVSGAGSINIDLGGNPPPVPEIALVE